MSIVVTIWWLFFFSALGLCLGSFINVVIYRLPRGIAISKPVWSFCPHCHNSIAWYDNLPVISYLMLRGRCRNCWKPIAARYFVVELATAIMVLLLVDTFFIAAGRDGLARATDINWRIAEDWPIFLAHLILFISLLAMSAIDIQHYWVDIRFTHLAAACGVILHTIWTPLHSRIWPRPMDLTALAATAAFIGFALVWLILQLAHRRRLPDEQPNGEHPEPTEDDTLPKNETRSWALLIPLLVFAFMVVAIIITDLDSTLLPFPVRAAVPILFLLGVIVYEASHVRDSDTEIIEAIESEAPHARRTALAEMAMLAPAAALGIAVLWITLQRPEVFHSASELLHWEPARGHWQPVWGLTTAVTGYVIAAAVGWSVRITATLVIGKEAFATGDIHMMAAAGCVLGWQATILGFVAACFLAVIGWVVLLPIKRTRAIPLGPWLAIGFLSVVVFYDEMIETQVIRNLIDVTSLIFFNNSQPAGLPSIQ